MASPILNAIPESIRANEELRLSWAVVLGNLHYLQGFCGFDDAAMATAAQDDLFAWVDDLESRLGYDVATLRAAMLDFVTLRDDVGIAGIVAHAAELAAPRHVAAYIARNPGALWNVSYHVYNDGIGHYHAQVIGADGRVRNMICSTSCSDAVARVNDVYSPIRADGEA